MILLNSCNPSGGHTSRFCLPESAGQIPPTPSFKKENLWLETVPSVSHGWYIFLPPDGSSYLGTVSRHRS